MLEGIICDILHRLLDDSVFDILQGDFTRNNLGFHPFHQTLELRNVKINTQFLEEKVLSVLGAPLKISACEIGLLSIKFRLNLTIEVLLSGVKFGMIMFQRPSEFQDSDKEYDKWKVWILDQDFMFRKALVQFLSVYLNSMFPFLNTNAPQKRFPDFWEAIARKAANRVAVTISDVMYILEDGPPRIVWQGTQQDPSYDGYGFRLVGRISKILVGPHVPNQARDRYKLKVAGGMIQLLVHIDNVSGACDPNWIPNSPPPEDEEQFFTKHKFLDDFSVTTIFRVGGLNEKFKMSIYPVVEPTANLTMPPNQFRKMIFALMRITTDKWVRIAAGAASSLIMEDFDLHESRKRFKHVLNESHRGKLNRRRWVFAISGVMDMVTRQSLRFSEQYIHCRRLARKAYIDLYMSVIQGNYLAAEKLLATEHQMRLNDILMFREFAVLKWLYDARNRTISYDKRLSARKNTFRNIGVRESYLYPRLIDLILARNIGLNYLTKTFAEWENSCPIVSSLYDTADDVKSTSELELFCTVPKVTLALKDKDNDRVRQRIVVENANVEVIIGIASGSVIVDLKLQQLIAYSYNRLEGNELMIENRIPGKTFDMIYRTDGYITPAPEKFSMVLHPLSINCSASDLDFIFKYFIVSDRRDVARVKRSATKTVLASQRKLEESHNEVHFLRTKFNVSTELDIQILDCHAAWGPDFFPVQYCKWWHFRQGFEPQKYHAAVIIFKVPRFSLKSVPPRKLTKVAFEGNQWKKDPGETTSDHNVAVPSRDHGASKREALEIEIANISAKVIHIRPYGECFNFNMIDNITLKLHLLYGGSVFNLAYFMNTSISFSLISISLKLGSLAEITKLFMGFMKVFIELGNDMTHENPDLAEFSLGNKLGFLLAPNNLMRKAYLKHFLLSDMNLFFEKGIKITMYKLQRTAIFKKIEFEICIQVLVLRIADYITGSQRLGVKCHNFMAFMHDALVKKKHLVLHPFDCQVIQNLSVKSTGERNISFMELNVNIGSFLVELNRINFQQMEAIIAKILNQVQRLQPNDTRKKTVKVEQTNENGQSENVKTEWEDKLLAYRREDDTREFFIITLKDCRSGLYLSIERTSTGGQSLCLRDMKQEFTVPSSSFGNATEWGFIEVTKVDGAGITHNFLSVSAEAGVNVAKWKHALGESIHVIGLKRDGLGTWKILGVTRQKMVIQHISGLFLFVTPDNTAILQKYPSYFVVEFEDTAQENIRIDVIRAISRGSVKLSQLAFQIIWARDAKIFDLSADWSHVSAKKLPMGNGFLGISCSDLFLSLSGANDLVVLGIGTKLSLKGYDLFSDQRLDIIKNAAIRIRVRQENDLPSLIWMDLSEFDLDITEEFLQIFIRYRQQVLNYQRRAKLRARLKKIWADPGEGELNLDNEREDIDLELDSFGGIHFIYFKNLCGKRVWIKGRLNMQETQMNETIPLDFQDITYNESDDSKRLCIEDFDDIKNFTVEDKGKYAYLLHLTDLDKAIANPYLEDEESIFSDGLSSGATPKSTKLGPLRTSPKPTGLLSTNIFNSKSNTPTAQSREDVLDILKNPKAKYVIWEVSRNDLNSFVGVLQGPIVIENNFQHHVFELRGKCNKLESAIRHFNLPVLFPKKNVSCGLDLFIADTIQIKPKAKNFAFSKPIDIALHSDGKPFIVNCPLVKNFVDLRNVERSRPFFLLMKVVRDLVPLQKAFSLAPQFVTRYRIWVSPVVEVYNWLYLPIEIMLITERDLQEATYLAKKAKNKPGKYKFNEFGTVKDVELERISYSETAQFKFACTGHEKYVFKMREIGSSWSSALGFRIHSSLKGELFEDKMTTSAGVVRVSGRFNDYGTVVCDLFAPYQIHNRIGHAILKVFSPSNHAFQNSVHSVQTGIPKYFIHDVLSFGIDDSRSKKLNLLVDNYSSIKFDVDKKNSEAGYQLTAEIRLVKYVSASQETKISRTVGILSRLEIRNESRYGLDIADDCQLAVFGVDPNFDPPAQDLTMVPVGATIPFHRKKNNIYNKVRILLAGYHWSGPIDLRRGFSTALTLFKKDETERTAEEVMMAIKHKENHRVVVPLSKVHYSKRQKRLALNDSIVIGVDLIVKDNRKVLIILDNPRNGYPYKMRNHSTYNILVMQRNFCPYGPSLKLSVSGTDKFAYSSVEHIKNEILIVAERGGKISSPIPVELDQYGAERQLVKKVRMRSVELIFRITSEGFVRVLHIMENDVPEKSSQIGFIPPGISLRPPRIESSQEPRDPKKVFFSFIMDQLRIRLRSQETGILSIVCQAADMTMFKTYYRTRLFMKLGDFWFMNDLSNTQDYKVLSRGHRGMDYKHPFFAMTFIRRDPNTPLNRGSLNYVEELDVGFSPLKLRMDTTFLERLLYVILGIRKQFSIDIQSNVNPNFEELQFEDRLSYYKTLKISALDLTLFYTKKKRQNFTSDLIVPPAISYVLTFLISLQDVSILLRGLELYDAKFYGNELQVHIADHYAKEGIGQVRSILGGAQKAVGSRMEYLLGFKSEAELDADEDGDDFPKPDSRFLTDTGAGFLHNWLRLFDRGNDKHKGEAEMDTDNSEAGKVELDNDATLQNFG